jgi:hypothetical protein
VLDLQKGLRDSLIKVPDQSFCYFINNINRTDINTITHESLANIFRPVATHFRNSAKYVEHLWFIEEFFGEQWKCLACPNTSQQSKLAALRVMIDGFFSAIRWNSSALSRRLINEGRSKGLLLLADESERFVDQYSSLTSKSCGNHKSNSSTSGSKTHVKDENALFGSCCSHGMFMLGLFIRQMGERFVHGVCTLQAILKERPWLKSMIVSYDLACKFKPFLEV